MSHVFHIYTYRQGDQYRRTYQAECECGWTSPLWDSALHVRLAALDHAPGAVQFEPYHKEE